MRRRDLLTALGTAGGFAALTGRPSLGGFRPPLQLADPDLHALVTAAIVKFSVPGASVAVFRDGRLSVAAAGLANVATGVELTTDTVMHIGSITKVLNTTLVMQLVDEGRVDLEAPLIKYLPEFRVADPDATRRITVKMLVNHTSGINGELTPEAGHDRERIVDAIGRIAAMDQLHPPGADLSYCNPGTVLAGYLCQQLLGKSWYDLVKERIFRPLGMDHSIVVPEDALLHRASVGHFLPAPGGKPVRTSFAFLPLSYAPAGATAMLSATDLVTFARAHLSNGVAPNGHRLLSEKSARMMRTKTASYQGPGFADFGLGWMLGENGMVSHGGGGPGILSGLYAHPGSNTAVAVLTNAAHGTSVVNAVASPVLEATAKIPPLGSAAAALVKRATDAPVALEPYGGQYESAATVVRIVAHGTGIALTSRSKFTVYDTTSLTESPPVPLRPIDRGRFAFGSALLGFVNPGPDGRMGHLAMSGRLIKRVG
ncbi:MAG: serine hydrolase domain-containing protein [Gemmatimonadales bacterium]